MDKIIPAIGALLGAIGPSNTAISAVIAMLAKLAPSLGGSSVGKAIEILNAVLVPGIKLVMDEIPVIKAIIADLKRNGATTAEQMDQLDAFNAQCDALVDDAIAKAEAEDQAPG